MIDLFCQTADVVWVRVLEAATMGLTRLGYGWALLSAVASVCALVGFYVPRWIVGSLTIEGRRYDAFFGSFRRCNYPVFDYESGTYRVEERCGRYSTFGDIPSVYWQAATVTVALGCSLSVLLTLVLVPACCVRDIVSRSTALLIGLMQVLAAVGVSVGCVIYPLGWNVREVKEACGTAADQFILGNCSFGCSYVLMLVGSALLIVCGAMSVKGGREGRWEDPLGADEQALMHSLCGPGSGALAGALPT